MKRILLTAHATLAMAATRATDEGIELGVHDPEPVFQRYDIREPKHYARGPHKMRCKRENRDPDRAKVKAARKQRNRK